MFLHNEKRKYVREREREYESNSVCDYVKKGIKIILKFFPTSEEFLFYSKKSGKEVMVEKMEEFVMTKS